LNNPHLYDVKKGKKGSVTTFVTGAFSDHVNYMRSKHRSWALNLAWTKGHQNCDYNPKTNAYNKLPTQTWQSRLISNLMLPIVRNNVSRFLSINPVWDMVPATPDEEDLQIADISKSILTHEWHRMNMLQKLMRVLFWQSTCSSSFLKIGWDADSGDSIKVPSRDIDEGLLNQYLEMSGIAIVPDELDLQTGNVFAEPIPPFNICVDPLASVLEDTDYIIETQIRSKDSIVNDHGNKWKDKLGETNEQQILLHPYVFNEDEPVPKTGVVTHELFVRSTKRFPKGLYCLIAGEEILVAPKDLPYDHGMLPYAHFLEIYEPGSFWGTCSAEQVRPNQARYNKIQSVITDCINKMGKIQWLNPTQSGIQDFTNAPGEVYNYRHPFKPEQTKPANIPMYMLNALEGVRRDMQDTASFHNVSQAQGEPGVRSGRAIMALQDADDSIHGAGMLWLDHSLKRTGELTLRTLNQYATEERIIQITGEFNQLETLTYTGAMLEGQNPGDYFNVRVQTHTRNSMSRVGRESLIMNLMQAGIMDPEKDRKVVLQMLGMADTMSMFDELDVDRTRQWKEIQQMEAGQEVGVMPNENHEIHKEVITKYLAGSRREKLSPEALKLIQKHMTQHMEMEVMEALQQQMMVQKFIGDSSGGTAQNRGNGSQNRSPSRGSGASNTGVNTTQ